MGQLKAILADETHPQRDYLLARLLADANHEDIWRLTTPQAIWSRWEPVVSHLGWSRPMWTFIFDCWRQDGLVA